MPHASSPFSHSGSFLKKSWSRIPVWIRSILTGLFVSTLGVTLWGVDLTLVRAPWSILIMILPLWLFWKYFSGHGGRPGFRELRAKRFRSVKLPARIWKWGLAGSLLFVLAIQSSFVISFRIIQMPPAFTSEYPLLETLPRPLSWALLIMGSIVAGICEETGFRGYMQVPLEKHYGAVKAILIVSLIFCLIHLSKAWAIPILPNILLASIMLGILAYRSGSLIPGIIGHSILDVFDYSFWWTHLLGKWQRLTLFETGIDIHFTIWSLIFAGSLLGFFWSMARLRALKRSANQ
jgi:membrane protease YdiL (CAAX protease family)